MHSNPNKSHSKLMMTMLVALSCLAIAACSDNFVGSQNSAGLDQNETNLTQGQAGSLTLQIVASNISEKEKYTQSSLAEVNSVTVTAAKIVIGRIRFDGAGGETAEFKSNEPLIIDLSTENWSQTLGTVSIPAGSYDESRFRIEKLSDGDSAIFADNEDMQDLSIIVEGYVDGDEEATFAWSASFMEDQRHEFEPVTIEDGVDTELTFELDMTSWFSDGEEGLLDPRDADTDGSVQSQIEHNIKAAFKVTEE